MALPDYTTIGQGGFAVSGDYYRPVYTPQTSPSYTAANPYYDPNYQYGGNPNQVNTEMFDLMANNDPEAYYNYWLAQHGFAGNRPQDKLARGLYDRFQQGYSAAQLVSPELRWTDYLGQQNLSGLTGNLSYEDQGIDVGRYQGRDRWGLRGG